MPGMAAKKGKPRKPVVDYTSLMELGGTFKVDHGKSRVNPPILWNNSNEKGVASWLLDPGSKKKYKDAQKMVDLGTNLVSEALHDGDFGGAFKQSNQQYYRDAPKMFDRGAHFKVTRDPTNQHDAFYRDPKNGFSWDMFKKLYVPKDIKRDPTDQDDRFFKDPKNGFAWDRFLTVCSSNGQGWGKPPHFLRSRLRAPP